MYKDPEKQKEANRKAQQKFKVKHKGITEGITLPCDIEESIECLSNTPEEKVIRRANAERYQSLYPDMMFNPQYIDREFALIMAGAEPSMCLPVSKPGDLDYRPSGVVERCRYCLEPLPQLEHPRQCPDVCLACVMKGAA